MSVSLVEISGKLAFASGSIAAASGSQTFNYFISPTGSDTNAGTFSSPWAITSLSAYAFNANNVANNASIAGKRVGLLPGTYSIVSLLETWATHIGPNGGDSSYYGDGYSILFCLPSGSAGSPTYIGGCNSSGVYAPGNVTIDGGNAQVNSNAVLVPVIGQGDNSGTLGGYVTIAGLKFINTPFKTVEFGGSNNFGSNTNIQGWTVQDSEFTSINWSTALSGGNNSAIELIGAQGAVITNNYFHGFTGEFGSTDGNHCNATIQWWSLSTTYSYNTMLGPGMYGKEGGNAGTTIQYNYIDNTGWTSSLGIQDFVGQTTTATGLTTTIHHNVVVSNTNDLRPTLGGTYYFPDPLVVYSNTFVNTPDTSQAQFTGLSARVVPGDATYYDNIHWMDTTVQFYYSSLNVDAASAGQMDYNLYYTTATANWGSYSSDTQTGAPTGYSTFSSFKNALANTNEAHSVSGSDPKLDSIGSTGASNYKLGSGSAASGAGTTSLSGGTATDMGAWGNSAPASIGSSLGPS
jgi:hypothetical protein